MRDMEQSALHECVREAILDSVGRLLEKYGYKKMTVEDIANEAGIGKGTVYLYFPSKEEVALSWFDRAHKQTREELWSIARSNATPELRLRKMLIKRVMLAFDNTQRFVQSLEELFSAVRSSFFVRRTKYHASLAEIFGKVLIDGNADGTFQFTDIDAAAHALILATNSLLPYSLSTAQLGERDEIETKANMIANLLLSGLLYRNITDA